MRICLVSNTSIASDPRALAEAEILRLAGHDVFGAAAADPPSDWISSPEPPGVVDRILRRNTPERISNVGSNLGADLYVPIHPSATETAVGASTKPRASVLVRPSWPRPTDRDLIELAPSEPQRSLPASGYVPMHHRPGADEVSHIREDGNVVVAYRKSNRNPGRYVESALERAGLEVRHVERIDWESIDPSTLAVIVVESPLPALAVHSQNPGVPVIFWVHHGEHHLHANVRLQRHYGAHAVVMAHSWHLSHYFTGVVDRLPFAVAPEIFPRSFKPHEERHWDVGFVGAITDDESRYSRRERLLREIEERLGDERLVARSGIDPEEMAAVYCNSRVVIDDGAGPHLPITMRVFEATGAGALLLTREGPGLDQLLNPGIDYLRLGDDSEAVMDPLRGDTESIAESAHQAVWSRHTYDHRVAELLAIAQRIREEGTKAPDPLLRTGGLVHVIERFPDAQRVLDLGGSVTGRLPGREVWDYERAEDRAEPGTFHISVLSGGTTDQRRRAIAAARIAVVASSDEANLAEEDVRSIQPEARRHDLAPGTVFTFGAKGYRTNPDPDPR